MFNAKLTAQAKEQIHKVKHYGSAGFGQWELKVPFGKRNQLSQLTGAMSRLGLMEIIVATQD